MLPLIAWRFSLLGPSKKVSPASAREGLIAFLSLCRKAKEVGRRIALLIEYYASAEEQTQDLFSFERLARVETHYFLFLNPIKPPILFLMNVGMSLSM